ncbi:MAG: 6-pyruvoyl tetrahydropterin synthase family protein [Planctomycetota bacterium]|nr:6-pyruvoyl tetrahydropterin synthase family protein [Planctomycetota bacterium]
MSHSNSKYRVRVTKDHLVFSAAHFITFAGNICERLHGHNWRVAVELAGPLDENQYVFDFIALRDAAQQIVAELDHSLLLPTLHPKIRVQAGPTEVEVRFEERRWILPLEDCRLLPVEVEVEENFGQWAICTRPLGQEAGSAT